MPLYILYYLKLFTVVSITIECDSMTLSKIGVNGVNHWRSEREDDFRFLCFFLHSFGILLNI